ncbi:MAG: hypothetical protein C5B59_15845 [Bacteroidetes bacterium]|nr:MAG: hypothetical protein C5B59_15845 [Bacteroidota bacterium]
MQCAFTHSSLKFENSFGDHTGSIYQSTDDSQSETMKHNINKHKMKKIFFLALIIASVIFSCGKSYNSPSASNNNNTNTVDCSGGTKSFASVSSIIESTCATNSGCHGAGSNNGPGPLLTYSQIFNARSNIRSAVASGVMPLGGSLSVNDKLTILCWIDSGAPAN